MNADTVALIAVLGSFIATVGTVIGTILINRAQARKTTAEAKVLEKTAAEADKKKNDDEAERQLVFLKRVGEMYDATIARDEAEIKTQRAEIDCLNTSIRNQNTEIDRLHTAASELRIANERARLAIVKFVHAFEIYIDGARPSPKVQAIKQELADLKAMIA